jgi:hypothetical protein
MDNAVTTPRPDPHTLDGHQLLNLLRASLANQANDPSKAASRRRASLKNLITRIDRSLERHQQRKDTV